MDQRERNRRRIAMVGSSSDPPPGEMPLGTVIETEPEWVCCCCDQDIPRPSTGFSTAVGSFCSKCFVAYMEHLFNKSGFIFLNKIREESYRFIHNRREDFENGVQEPPKLRAMKGAKVERLLGVLEELADVVDGHVSDGDCLDSLTTQPARIAIIEEG